MLTWKLKRGIETCVLIQNDSKKIKSAAGPRLYKGDQVVGREWGTEREGGEDVRCEDVTQTLLHTDAFTYKRSFAEPFLHIDAFTYTDAFTHRSFFHTHTRLYAQTLLHTDTFYAHTHTLAQTSYRIVMWNATVVQKHQQTKITRRDEPVYIYMYVYIYIRKHRRQWQYKATVDKLCVPPAAT